MADQQIKIPLPDNWPSDERTTIRTLPQFGVVAIHPDRETVRYDFASEKWVKLGKVTFKLGPPQREDQNNG